MGSTANKPALEVNRNGEYIIGPNSGCLLRHDHIDEEYDTHYVYYWTGQECPLCHFEKVWDKQLKEERAKSKALRREIKLLKYELADERTKHNQTKSEAAHYLVTKKKVEDEIRDKL